MLPSEEKVLAHLRKGHTGSIRTLRAELHISHNSVQRALWELEKRGLVVRFDEEQRKGRGIRGNIWACTGPSNEIKFETPEPVQGPIVESALLTRTPLELWMTRI